jgi:hypothetical protein
MPTQHFWIGVHDKQAGPFDLKEMRAKTATGELTPDTLVWQRGMESWLPAGQAPGLASLFGANPPPLPPR